MDCQDETVEMESQEVKERGETLVCRDHLVFKVPYTRVNKRIRLFAKPQGNMRLIPNMRLIAKGKIDHTSKTAMPSLVARVLESK